MAFLTFIVFALYLFINVNTEFAEWNAWGRCSTSCGAGQEKRVRVCTSVSCTGEAMESRPCSLGICPTWNEWNSWTNCDVTCGIGKKTRDRTCVPTTLQCSESTTSFINCFSGLCADAWKPWGSWSRCSRSCGTGRSVRHRYCKTPARPDQCTGPSMDTLDCNTFDCGSYVWGSWGSCSASCGKGQQIRSRACLQGEANCDGVKTASRDCFAGQCVSASGMTDWARWTRCSTSCGSGTQRRYRICIKPGGGCSGDTVQSQACPGLPACPYWEEWTEWGDCGLPCGESRQWRTRVCNGEGCTPANGNKEYKVCGGPCPAWAVWESWTDCSGSAVEKTRSRYCWPYAGCTGDSSETASCTAPPEQTGIPLPEIDVEITMVRYIEGLPLEAGAVLIFINANSDSWVKRIDNDGNILPQFDVSLLGSEPSGFILDGSNLYTILFSGEIMLFDWNDMSLIQTYSTGLDSPRPGALLSGNVLLLCTYGENSCYTYNLDTGVKEDKISIDTPTFVSLDQDGGRNRVIVCSLRAGVKVYDDQYQLLFSVGSGLSDGQLTSSYEAFALPNGNILAADYANGRISEFSAHDGSFIRHIVTFSSDNPILVSSMSYNPPNLWLTYVEIGESITSYVKRVVFPP